MTTMAFGAPSRYLQGPGELQRLAVHTSPYGGHLFVLIDSFFYEDLSQALQEQFQQVGMRLHPVCFQGEITARKIEALAEEARTAGCDVVCGIGGGKTLDTAKAVAAQIDQPLLIVPTSASTDAPTSAMSVIYNDAHEHADVYYYRRNPDLVLVDSQIIADAPVRFLVSGMGDALATVYEARATIRTGSPNYINQEAGPYVHTQMAAQIAELCGQTVLRYGIQARADNEAHRVSAALERIIEANVLMSGLGFENVGCAASHVICNGITACPMGDQSLHGEKVAYGILCQLTAEGAPKDEIEEIMAFYEAVGLPLQLADLGVEASEENLDIISRDTANTEWTREPFPMTDADVRDVVRRVEARGRAFRADRRGWR